MSILPRLFLVALLLPASLYASDPYVPDELQDWRDWVLEGREYLDCPRLFNSAGSGRNDYVCAWPGSLQLAVNARGGRFTQQWTVYGKQQWVPLPGSAEHWPEQVTANSRSFEVVDRDGSPSMYLPAGTYRVAGSFGWDEQPGVLRIPAQSGLISLEVDGKAIERPERNDGGIFLGEREREQQAQDAVATQVYRLVADNVPTRLITELRIDVAGGVREELFGPVLPDGFIPLAIDSQLPARLEPDGRLRVQVRPGRWTISLQARGPGVLDAIALPEPEANLPDTEIWSYRSNDRLRVTAAEGLAPVDPAQVQVPAQWQSLPAFRIQPGETLTLVERSRGIVAAENELNLERQMWLDFDGDGFVVSDLITGKMRADWRLDMAVPFTLLNAAEGGENLLITLGDEEGETGIELRRTDVNVEALGRADTRAALPVSGWDARFAEVNTHLHVPPGNKLLAAPGADSAPGSWVSRWQLLDFFLVLIITIGAWRMFGRTAGAIALVAMVLSYHEPFAPSWLWLNLLVAVALMRVAPPGKLRQTVLTYQSVSALVLVLVLMVFSGSQLRTAIYPQLEPQTGVWGGVFPAAAVMERSGYADMEPPAVEVDKQARRLQAQPSIALEEVRVSFAEARRYARYAPNSIVQAGPGIPSWAWNTYRLGWSGPVDADQSLRLVIMPRWLVTTLRFVEVLAMLLFAAVFAAEILKRRFELPGGVTIGSTSASSLLVAGMLCTMLAVSPNAEAQTPDPVLLEELESRLTRPPECAPRCAELVVADVDVEPSAVRMLLTIHALDEVAIPLPGSEQGWRPTAIAVAGDAASQVMRNRDRALWLRLGAGQHTVTLSGAVPVVDSLEIPFPSPPRAIQVDSDGWFVAGIKDRRLLSGSLQLTRLQTGDSGDTTLRWESSRFPAFARVERAIDLDLDWTVTTTVFRVAPVQGAVTLEVPLIDGESVVTEGIAVDDGKALVSMDPNQRSVSWRSNLPRVSPLTLEAAPGAPWKEVWWVGVGSIWHAEFSGVPESENPRGPGEFRTAEFFPRGGETLTIDAGRPDASVGSTLAFDAVKLSVTHGGRSSTVTLDLSYRSTRGAQHVLRLPEAAEVTAVLIDDQLEPLRAENGELTVPILPGKHRIHVNWRETGDVGIREGTPAVDIGAPASNITLETELPRDRWLLATSGPKLGPGVLYWSELVVLLLFAAILGRIELTPLAARHWVLLGLGFSTFSWPVLGVVIAWLLICGARQKLATPKSWWRFNLLQVVIAGATVISLGAIVTGLTAGLLGTPDMHVIGNGSWGNSLNWFADSAAGVLPDAVAWSVPLWVYKTLILAWALWLSFALIRWLPWVWQCFSSEGYWRARTKAG